MTKFKTKPYKHQLKALKLSQDEKAYALLMEQGTGKSKVVIDTIAHLRRRGEIDVVLIIAPKGVAPGWLRQQFPEHMPDDVSYSIALWKSASNLTKMGLRQLTGVLDRREGLRVFVMNVEAYGATKDAIDFAIDALDSATVASMIVVDESHRIKTPTAHTTKRVLNLRDRCEYRRILTGTVGDKPFDLFSQFGFLDPEIIGVDNFTAFRNEYAEMMPANSGLMRHIIMRQKIPMKWTGKYLDAAGDVVEKEFDEDGIRCKKQMAPAYLPPIVKTDADGRPKYKNLDKLRRLIEPHSYRVLKADCLDLPEKIYKRFYTELTQRQRKLYEELRETQRIEWEDGRISVFNKLTALLRRQQLICGYIGGIDGQIEEELFPNWEDNPRICSLLDMIQDRPENEFTIIWCRFIPDIKRVTEMLRDKFGLDCAVQFYGAVSDRDRLENVARFQGERQIMNRKGEVERVEPVPDKQRARFMVAQQHAGGVGQTWTAATLSVFYSNSFSLIDRLQAEDRPHRIGQRHVVEYMDIEAEESDDTMIIGSLVAKKDVADTLNNDPKGNWI